GCAARGGPRGDRRAEPARRPRLPHGRRGPLGVHDRRREPGCLTGAPMSCPLPHAGSSGGPSRRAPAGNTGRGKIPKLPVPRSLSPSLRSLVSLFLLGVLLVSSSVLTAQPAAKAAAPAAAAGEVVLQAYTLRHQRASDAVALVYPLLSRKGTVELQPGGNTLVIRDVQSALNR